jgi:phage shock protein PspC (stress-responsive transcriptional regulator)
MFFKWILSLVGVFKAKKIAGVCRGFAAVTFGTSFRVKNVAWNFYFFLGFM